MKKIPMNAIQADPNINSIWQSIDENVRFFWDEVQDTLKKSIIIPTYYDGDEESWGFFANLQPKEINLELQEFLGFPRMFVLTVVKDFKSFDVAHELAHVAISTMYGYSFLQQQGKPASREETEMLPEIALVFDAAIHPAVDALLKQRDLFSDEFYERKYDDVIASLNRQAKSISKSEMKTFKNAFQIIEAKHRLPESMYKKVISYANDVGLGPIVSFAKTLPIFEFDYSNQKAFKIALLNTYKKIGINFQKFPLFKLTTSVE